MPLMQGAPHTPQDRVYTSCTHECIACDQNCTLARKVILQELATYLDTVVRKVTLEELAV